MTDPRPAARARRRLSGVARRGARRLRDRTPVRRLVRPGVSVILPIYNVEAYLAECLESILEQDYSDFELLVVDDGSRDGSRAIAEEYAARDQRIRIVTRENGGLGAARNTGVEHARGRYLTFVDSDDRLPPHALQVLVDSARRTGSDMVVGAVRRFDEFQQWRPQWVNEVHQERRERITIEDFPPLLRNLYTWNKLFSRDFYLAQGLRFRERVAYEDQPIITQLYARAGSIDVVTETVYEYRARSDQSSISQQTATVKDLDARIQAWQVSRDVIRAEASDAVYEGWLQTLFDAHFHWYLASNGTVDDEYWRKIQAAVADLTADVPQHIWDAAMPHRRVLLELTRQDRRADAQEFVRRDAHRLDKWQCEVRPDGIMLKLPFHGDPDLDEQLFLLRREQLILEHSVENVHWLHQEDGRAFCQISGWAFLRKVDQAQYPSDVTIVLRRPDGTEHRVPSTERPRAAFPPPSDDQWCDYSPGTFLAELPLGDLMADSAPDESWAVLVEVAAAGFTVTEPVVQLLRSGSAGVIPAADLGNGDRIVADWRQYAPLRFRRVPQLVQAESVRLDGRTLAADLAGPGAADLARVVVSSGRVSAETKVMSGPDGRRSFSLTLPAAPDVRRGEATGWAVSGRDLGDRWTPITLPGAMGMTAVETLDRGALAVERTRNSELALTEWRLGAIAESIDVTRDGVLRISGRVLGSRVTAVALASRHKKARAYGAEVPLTDGRFEAEIELRHELFRFGLQPLPIGDHDLHVRLRVEGRDQPVEVPVKMSGALSADLPVAVQTEHYEGRVIRGPENGVRLVLVRPIGDARGHYQQALLRRAAPTGKIHRGLFLRAYFGEYATDNGLSVQRELARRGSDLPVYWAVQDHSVPVPDGGIPVVVNSREYYQLLSSAKYYIDNMYQPEHYRKTEGQVIVQTFHGYPFKQMGHPHWRNLGFAQARIDAYDDRAREWDYLVSPARYATPLLTRDFNYPGEVLEIGYPRNDILLSDDAGRLGAQVRASLGIRPDQKVVLYAPTFRDYMSKDDMRAVMVDFFDFAEAHRELGDEYVFLLRGHAFNARTSKRRGPQPGTIDVTDYPEVSDLYLAADAAIVDYSSLRFDFGVTGKPMVFHVPDLQRYKDTRGWLFDFEPTAPGPLVATTAEVVDELRDLDGLRARHRAAYERFRQDYLDLEDGHAGQRLVDAVFAPRGDA